MSSKLLSTLLLSTVNGSVTGQIASRMQREGASVASGVYKSACSFRNVICVALRIATETGRDSSTPASSESDSEPMDVVEDYPSRDIIHSPINRGISSQDDVNGLTAKLFLDMAPLQIDIYDSEDECSGGVTCIINERDGLPRSFEISRRTRGIDILESGSLRKKPEEKFNSPKGTPI